MAEALAFLSCLTLALLMFLSLAFSLNSAAFCQEAGLKGESPEELKKREEWLRYSNWEFKHRSPKEPKSLPGQTQIPFPEHPGAQSVSGISGQNQFLVPNWSQKKTQVPPRPDLVFNASVPCWRLYGSTFNSYYYGFGGACSSGSRIFSSRRSRLGPMVTQMGPSPSSGNYYQPSSADPSSSGGYYAGSDPWVTPVIGPQPGQSSYWGMDGSPFSKP